MIYGAFLIHLAATVLIEGIFIGIWFRRLDYVYYSVLCNVLTNPALNLMLLFVVRLWGRAYYLPALIVLETSVVLVEALVLKLLCRFRLEKAILVSCILNAGSLLLGMLCDVSISLIKTIE